MVLGTHELSFGFSSIPVIFAPAVVVRAVTLTLAALNSAFIEYGLDSPVPLISVVPSNSCASCAFVLEVDAETGEELKPFLSVSRKV